MKRSLFLACVVAFCCALTPCTTSSMADREPLTFGRRTPLLARDGSPLHSRASRQAIREPWPTAPNRQQGGLQLLAQPLPSTSIMQSVGPTEDNFPISDYVDTGDLAERQERPAIAYNATADEYLVVWQGFTATSKWDIYAQRLSADGTPTGEIIVISSAADTQASPDVAYNAAATEYLVVWHDRRSGQQWDIYGQRISGTGTPVGETLVVASGSEDQGWPRVAVSPTNNQYLVVWNEYHATTKWDVCAIRLNSQGQGVENAFDIIATVREETLPVLAYHDVRDEYLVIWEDPRDYYPTNGWDLYAQRLSATGSLVGNDFAVSDTISDQLLPDVAYNTITEKYVVAWQDHRGGAGGSGIYAQRVSGLGTREGPEIQVSAVEGRQMAPRVAYSAGAEGYLIVWEDERSGTGNGFTCGQRISSSGGLLEPAFGLSAGGMNYQTLVVAAGSSLEGWVATWQDGRNISGDEIFGQEIDASGSILATDVAIARASRGQEMPDVALGDPSTGQMVVWMDYRNETDYDVFGQRLGTDGSPVGDNVTLLSRANSQGAPQIAYTPADNEYFIVAHSMEGTDGFDILGMRIDSAGSLIGDIHLLSESTATGDEGFPSIAYNSQRNEYLVAWHAFTEGSWNIHAQRITANGSLQGNQIVACQAPHEQEFTSIAYNPTNDEYAVVWQDQRGGSQYDVYVQLISRDGTPLGPNLSVSDSESDDCHPDIVYDGDLNGYLVVWEHTDPTTGSDIHACWLSGSGVPLGPGFAICATSGDQMNATAVYVRPAQEYLIAWEDYRLDVDSGDIYAQRISKQAGPTGDVFAVSAEDDYQLSPALPQQSGSGQLVVVWQDYQNANWDVYGQQIRVSVPAIYLPLMFK